jgi:hypothetical protein
MTEGSGIIPQRIARGSQHLHHLHQHLQQGDASGHVQLWEALGHLYEQLVARSELLSQLNNSTCNLCLVVGIIEGLHVCYHILHYHLHIT